MEAEAPTVRADATPSELMVPHPYNPPFLHRMPFLPQPSELWCLSGGKGGILSELLRAVLCSTVVHNGMHTNTSSSEIYV